MIWLAVFSALVAAQDVQALSPYPEPLERVEGECTVPIGLEWRRSAPRSLVASDGIVVCAATAVPVSQALDLVAIEVWSIGCRDQYGVVTSGLSTDLVNATVDVDALRQENVELSRKAKPILYMVIGAGATALIFGGGVALAVAL